MDQTLKGLIALLSAATGYDLCQGLSAEWGNCSRYFQKLQDWKKPVCNAKPPCNGNKIGKDKIKTGIAFGGFRSKYKICPRFFEQVGHEIMNASSENEHFFTKSCHPQT